MKEILFPYGKEKISYTFGDELSALLEPSINEYVPEADGTELVLRAMAEHKKSVFDCLSIKQDYLLY